MLPVLKRKRLSKAKIRAIVAAMAERIHGELRIANKGTPHIIYKGRTGITSSICYFANTNTWKVFWPWPSTGYRQRSQVFTEDELIKAIKPMVTVHNIKDEFILRDKDGNIIHTNIPTYTHYVKFR